MKVVAAVLLAIATYVYAVQSGVLYQRGTAPGGQYSWRVLGQLSPGYADRPHEWKVVLELDNHSDTVVQPICTVGAVYHGRTYKERVPRFELTGTRRVTIRIHVPYAPDVSETRVNCT